MTRSLVTCLLLLVILFTFGFVVLKSQANGPDDNYFNRELRSRFAVYPILRSILNLRFDGDARADYLGADYKKIVIEVDLMEDIGVHYEALDLLRSRIENITGKETMYIISDKNIPYQQAVDDLTIKNLTEKYRSRRSGGNTAAVYALYASREASKPDLLGSTYEEYGIVLFYDALADFAENNISVLQSYEASTLLHEFGHQIGLPHNSEEGCLMNESADQAVLVYEEARDVVTDFCEFEKQMLFN